MSQEDAIKTFYSCGLDILILDKICTFEKKR